MHLVLNLIIIALQGANFWLRSLPGMDGSLRHIALRAVRYHAGRLRSARRTSGTRARRDTTPSP